MQPRVSSPRQFTVTRSQILMRGLTLRCPNCGAKTLFAAGSYFHTAPACSNCQMRWDKDEAAFLGSLTLNYGFTVFGIVLPWCLINIALGKSIEWIAGGAIAAAVIFPILLYRISKSLWAGWFFFFMPQNLPANWQRQHEGDTPPEE